MSENANPDNAEEREIALSDVTTAVKMGLKSIRGWERASVSRPAKDTIVCRYPNGSTGLETGLINKVVQAIASLGWRTQSFYRNEVTMHRDGVKTRVALEFKPEQTIAFTVRFI